MIKGQINQSMQQIIQCMQQDRLFSACNNNDYVYISSTMFLIVIHYTSTTSMLHTCVLCQRNHNCILMWIDSVTLSAIYSYCHLPNQFYNSISKVIRARQGSILPITPVLASSVNQQCQPAVSISSVSQLCQPAVSISSVIQQCQPAVSISCVSQQCQPAYSASSFFQ